MSYTNQPERLMEYYSPKEVEARRNARRELLDATKDFETRSVPASDIFRVKCDCGLDTVVIGADEAQRYVKLHNSWCHET